MRVYSSMSTEDFVDQLRRIAINANASPLVIYQIDKLAEVPSEDEIEKREEESYQKGKDDIRKEWVDRLADAQVTIENSELFTESQKECLFAFLADIDPLS